MRAAQRSHSMRTVQEPERGPRGGGTAGAGVDDGPIAAARALRPEIEAAADWIERERRLPPTLVKQLAAADLFQLFLPRSMGGPEADPLTALRAVEELSKADGSVGWCSMIAVAGSLLLCWLPAAVGRALVGEEPDLRLCSSVRPQGTAVRVEGGYRISGRWNFSSGIEHANWMLGTCKVEDGAVAGGPVAGRPAVRGLLFPASAGRVEDTWSVVGMRGTGSHDLVVEELFVPAERSFSYDDPPCEAGPLYRSPFYYVAIYGANAGNSLGMARGAIETLAELAQRRGSSRSAVPLRERPLVQTRLAEAEAIVESARAYVLDRVGRAWEAMVADDPEPAAAIVEARLAITHAIREATRAVDLVFHAAGSNAVYRENRLERYFRDVHAAMQHVAGAPEHYTSAGQALLGLQPEAPGW